MMWANRLAASFVRVVSQFFRGLGWSACRFHPTCSVYADQAFKEMNFVAACGVVLKRIFRCHPFCEGGFDPLWKNER